MVRVDDLIQFYNAKLDIWSQAQDEFKLLMKEGFHCIQSFFVLINEIKGKLIKITPDHGVYKGKGLVDPQANQGGMSATGQTTATTTTENKEGKKVTKFTSYNNQTGAELTSYSFTNNKPADSGQQSTGS